MSRFLILALLGLVACDPKDPRTIAMENSARKAAKAEAIRAEVLRAAEGKCYFGCVRAKYEVTEPESDPTKRWQQAHLASVNFDGGPQHMVHAHARKDCPSHKDDLEKTLEVWRHGPVRVRRNVQVIVHVQKGRFVDAEGFFHAPIFCDTCTP